MKSNLHLLFSSLFSALLLFGASVHAGADLAWAKRAGGDQMVFPYNAATLPDGSSFVTGHFRGTATFGLGEANETVLQAQGGTLFGDAFLAKFRPDGSLEWVRQAGGPGDAFATDVTVLDDGSAAITGGFSGTVSFGPGAVLTAVGDWDVLESADVFVAKYLSDGRVAWVNHAGGEVDCGGGGGAIAATSDGGIMVHSTFRNRPDGDDEDDEKDENLTFFAGDGSPGITLAADSDHTLTFLAKYNSDGQLAWAKTTINARSTSASGIAAFADGSIAISGTFTRRWFDDDSEGIAFSPGSPDEVVRSAPSGGWWTYVAKYSATGQLQWTGLSGDSSTHSGGIAPLPDGSVVATGYFFGSPTFGFGSAGATVIESAGRSDAFVAKYLPGGALAWVKRVGGTEQCDGLDITAFEDGSWAITGRFQETAVFGSGESNETVLESAGGIDSFVAAYRPDGTLAWAERAGGAGNSSAMAIASFEDGGLLASGIYQDTIVFDEAKPGETVLQSLGGPWTTYFARYGAPERTPAGEVIQIGGEEVFAIRNGEPVALAEEDPVYVGDVIETGPLSFVRIAFNDGSQMSLGPEASMEVRAMEMEDSRPGLINLIRGKLRGMVEGDGDGSVRTRIQTRNVSIGVRGTEFEIEYSENGDTGTTTVTVESGTVEVADFAKGITHLLAEGDVLIVTTPVSESWDAYFEAVTAAGLSGSRALFLAAPFGDGVENLLKYAFNMNLAGPDWRRIERGASGASGLPAIELDAAAGTPALVIEFLRRRNGGLVYTPKFSSDMEEWTAADGPETVELIDDEWERVTVTQPAETGDGNRMFGRVKVALP